MKCQRKKIDGMECRSINFNMEVKAKALWHGFNVCSRCYSELQSIQRGHKEYLNHRLLSNKHCVVCGILLTRENRTGHCRNCILAKRRERYQEKTYLNNTNNIINEGVLNIK
jgi:hypothetical protein